ncbi:hypothetical protein HWV62_38318 [Athelia sp. TMB]|nr:hypothetical protein HWV62_38318 [Athelia sp. TMB]
MADREALRSIIVSQRLLYTREIAVFHHTSCGMTDPGFDPIALRQQILAPYGKNIPREVATALEAINFKPLGRFQGSVQDDVNFLREHPLILPETHITGWNFDVKSGRVCDHLIFSADTSSQTDVAKINLELESQAGPQGPPDVGPSDFEHPLPPG